MRQGPSDAEIIKFASWYDSLSPERKRDADRYFAQSASNDASAPSPAPSSAAAPDDGEIQQWLDGDISGLKPELVSRLIAAAKKLGGRISVTSGFRSRAEQQRLYDLYRSGQGNLAAAPGTSKHESGAAADVQFNGSSLGSTAEGRAAAQAAGLAFTVSGEPWHVEPA